MAQQPLVNQSLLINEALAWDNLSYDMPKTPNTREYEMNNSRLLESSTKQNIYGTL